MKQYVIQLHKGTPTDSYVVLHVDCADYADKPETPSMDLLEKIIDREYECTSCAQKGYLKEQWLILG